MLTQIGHRPFDLLVSGPGRTLLPQHPAECQPEFVTDAGFQATVCEQVTPHRDGRGLRDALDGGPLRDGVAPHQPATGRFPSRHGPHDRRTPDSFSPLGGERAGSGLSEVDDVVRPVLRDRLIGPFLPPEKAGYGPGDRASPET
ncbi:hypothetical protein [Actinoplanes subglobosus]|uniref:Uncharacterized protein n=1 Tax=Actinoplanes subglobosus TaxID=1547892 RepID=A0ABV8IX30_9ACTN